MFIPEKKIKNHCRKFYNELLQSITDKKLNNLIKNNTILAGGSIRSLLINTKINDYDLFFIDEKSVEEFHSLRFNVIFDIITDNAFTLKLNNKTIQFITKYYGEPKEVIEKFDFTNSMGYYYLKNDELNISPAMIESIDSQVLVYNPLCFSPEFSFRRALKFYNSGFKMNEDTLWSISDTLRQRKDGEINKMKKVIKKRTY